MTDTADLLARAIGAGYEIGELIGRGGFGEVYAATDRSLNRTVAIKVLRADVADSRTAVDRFRREAQALARLRHPHIMPVFGIGEGEGITYFVMPRIEGESLAGLMERGERLALAEGCRVIAEAADALAAAHRAGVVHRDIKPDNILLEGPERHALLMDFGIAKSGGAGEGKLTGTGMIVGTPFYMSPEQATGDHTGPASDIYSFGVVAYELLAGRPLFALATSPQHVIAAHLTRVPDDLRVVNPEIPVAISRAIMKCLRKEPAERWASVEEFSKAFGLARADLPRDPQVAIPETPPPLPGRARLVIGALGVAGVALAFAVYRFAAVPDLIAPRLSREAAREHARGVLAGLSDPSSEARAWAYARGGDVTAFFHRGGRSVDARALAAVPLGGWKFAFYTPGKAGYARVTVDAPGRVVELERQLDTTVPRSAPSDLAQGLPARLAAFGWSGDSLRLTDSSRAGAGAHEQRTYTWTSIGRAGPVIAGDSATTSVEATFAAGALTRFRAHVRLPPSETARRDRRGTVTMTLMVSLMVLVFIGLIVEIVRLRRNRALRLEHAPRLGLILALLLGLTTRVFSNSNGPLSGDFDPAHSQIAGKLGQLALVLLIICPTFFLVFTAIAAAAESVALQRAPGLLAGYRLLTTRPRPSRLAVFLPAGTALGLAIAGVAVLVAAVTAWIDASAFVADQVWTRPLWYSVSGVLLFVTIAPLAILPMAWLLVQARAIGQRRHEALGALLIGVAAAVFAVGTGMDVVSASMFVTMAVGLSLVVMRRGVMEAMVAFIAGTLTIQALEAWRAPFSDAWVPASVVLLIVAAAVVASLTRSRDPEPRTAAPASG